MPKGKTSDARISPLDEELFDRAAPRAASLIESLRAFGYELPTALADLVDNSITAAARHVWIDFHWDGDSSVISVTDDGRGMTAGELVSAMRPGSQNPLQPRAPNDLGRFGLGMKTASFSQSRRLTVRSRTRGGEWATRCWDLDHVARVDDWQLLRGADASAEPFFERLIELGHGTTVLWQKLDRLTGGTHTNNEMHHRQFLDRVDGVRRHLAIVFHQLMCGRRPVELMLNGRPVVPWDPYLRNEHATQTLPATRLPFRNAVVEVQPFILPHQSKISKETHEAAAGVRGWNGHQGFYIYRNQRLLVPGDWLGFGWAKEEHYKLARIRVEISNSLDHDWQIDVTKSRATPPAALRRDLRQIGERARGEAKRIYTFRGARLTPRADDERVLLWEPVSRHGKIFYKLNVEHPMVERVIKSTTDKRALNALFRLIEETIPYPHITISSTENPGSLPGPFDLAAEKQVREVMEQAFISLQASGYRPRDAVHRLRTIWPFELFPSILESFAERVPDA